MKNIQVKSILSRLVACYSNNRTGVNIVLREVDRFLKRNRKLEVKQVAIVPGGTVWRIRGKSAIKPIIFSGHVDTISPTTKWRNNPYHLESKGSHLIGLGVSDMKGSIAAWLAALLLCKEKLPQDVYLILSGDEETTGEITPKLIKKLKIHNGRIIVGEPTQNRIRIGQKGCIDLKITVTGKTRHGSRTSLAYNEQWSAIHRMRKVLYELWVYERSISKKRDPLFGSPTICLGTLVGGTTTTTTADSCTLTLSRRIVPSEGTLDKVEKELERAIRHGDTRAKITSLFNGEPWSISRTDIWLRDAQGLLKSIGESGSIYVDYPWTEAIHFSQMGKVIICGPGTPEQAHCANESIDIKDLERAVRFISALLHNN